MKKHLIIICGIYYPQPSPTGLCVKRIAELLSDSCDIEIISLSESGKDDTVIQNNGIVVHTLSCARLGLENRTTGVLKKAVHTVGSLQIKVSLLGNLGWFKKKATDKLHEINKKNKIDIVYSVCSPFAAHCAAYDFKQRVKAVCWCAYTVDPYATKNRIRPFFCSFEHIANVERKLLSAADTLLVSEEVFNGRRDLYEGHGNCVPLPYILPNENTRAQGANYFTENGIHCVYAGRLYPKLRDPYNMLKTFSAFEDKDIKLHLFSVGCDNMVNQYAQKGFSIVRHAQVSHEEILKIYSEADVLVNIGNNTSEFFPSKTFEYIVSCKPIVHFYGGGKRDELLEKYPLAIQVDNSAENIDERSIEAFIKDKKNRLVDSELIEKIFYKHTKDNIKSILALAMERGVKR